ncbi:hypothetical protein C4K68_16200 [Pokkaliibacter plantistimulans]|uniref:SURF1-like protein n=1 Tax=Proteobacteria bacterium 228 TaxID=2083153 RepID=A0A2S5KPV1_9PROT|nr:SURF1 family protein [Pokkaliibacter plantistimulans]PPC76326.1 hypothetical protein C4K68_16200 [Pokkaliibacter plantistimulans]
MSIAGDRRLNLWLLGLLLLGAAGVALGRWQWHRAEQKLLWEHTLTLPIMSFETLKTDWQDADQWLGRQVRVEGELMPHVVAFIDNQLLKGRPGLDVLGVMRLSDGRYVLVNRGWLAWSERKTLPSVVVPAGRVAISARVYPFSRPGLELGDYPDVSRGLQGVRLPWVDGDKLGAALGVSLLPVELRVEDNQPGMFQAHWKISAMSSATHRAYAWQWWGLTTMTWSYALWLFLRRTKQARRQHEAEVNSSSSY